MRILHFIDTLAAGGAERQLVYLLENLDRQRFESQVLTIYDEHRHYESTLQALGIPLYSLHHGALKMQNRTWAVGRYLRLMWALRPDVVHSWLHYTNLIARCARPFCPPHRLITAIRSQYSARQRRSEDLTAWVSDVRIVINQERDSHINRRSNTFYVPNAIPLNKFNTNTSFLDETQFPKTTFLTLTPARIDPNKGHIVLVNALAILKNRLPPGFQAIFIGEITSTHTQQTLERAVKHLRLQPFIRQLPPTHEIAPYYQTANLTILPSNSEGFSNVLLESLAAGKPIIVSEAANAVRLVVHGENGWVFPTGDSKALAQCLLKAMALSPDQLAEMGRKGRARVAEFSIERMVAQYTSIYEKLAIRL